MNSCLYYDVVLHLTLYLYIQLLYCGCNTQWTNYQCCVGYTRQLVNSSLAWSMAPLFMLTTGVWVPRDPWISQCHAYMYNAHTDRWQENWPALCRWIHWRVSQCRSLTTARCNCSTRRHCIFTTVFRSINSDVKSLRTARPRGQYFVFIVVLVLEELSLASALALRICRRHVLELFIWALWNCL